MEEVPQTRDPLSLLSAGCDEISHVDCSGLLLLDVYLQVGLYVFDGQVEESCHASYDQVDFYDHPVSAGHA